MHSLYPNTKTEVIYLDISIGEGEGEGHLSSKFCNSFSKYIVSRYSCFPSKCLKELKNLTPDFCYRLPASRMSKFYSSYFIFYIIQW